MAPLPFFPIQLCHFREHASGDQWSSCVPSNNRECPHSRRTTERVQVKTIQMLFLLLYMTVITAGGGRIWSLHCLHPRFLVTTCGFPSQRTDEESSPALRSVLGRLGKAVEPCDLGEHHYPVTNYYQFVLCSSSSFPDSSLGILKEQDNMGNSCFISVISS